MTKQEARSLAGQHAVITGGGRGIGAAVADSLADLGVKLTLMGRSLETLQLKCEQLPDAQAVTVDVCNASSVKQAFGEACSTFGPVTILVNNAGAAISSPLQYTDGDNWHYMLDVNLSGSFYCCREVLSGMKKNQWGRIVNIASIAGLAGAPYISAYCAAKHGVVGLTRALAQELASLDITVNALCPGYVNTDMLEHAITTILDKTPLTREQAEDELKSKNPQHRFIEPEEVASSVAWLCLPGSEGITGEAININGGGTGA